MANTTFDKERVLSEFSVYYQTTISNLKDGHPQLARMQDVAIINMQFDVLWNKIPKTRRIYDFDKMSEYQKTVFYKALIQQIFYVLKEGDFTDVSGYDVSTNTFLSPEQMDKIAISRVALKTLTDGGLMYRGLGDWNVSSRFSRRWM